MWLSIPLIWEFYPPDPGDHSGVDIGGALVFGLGLIIAFPLLIIFFVLTIFNIFIREPLQ